MMRRVLGAWAIGLVLVVVPACARQAAPHDARERAYRANNLGVAHLERFSYPEAAAAFREALQLDGSLAVARVNLSLALLYLQDFAGASREATEAARLLPSAPQPPYILALIARAEDRPADALREFERVRRLDATDVGTSVNVGQMYLQQQQYAEAIAVLRPAVALEPYNVSAAYNLGLALTRSGQAREGEAELQRAQALRSTGYAVTYGTGYLEQGRYAEAIASTGAEPELVDAVVPAGGFTPAAVGSVVPPAGRSDSPFGRSFSAGELEGEGARAIARGLGGCVTLADVDGDADLDVFVAAAAGQRLLRNEGTGRFVDATAGSGVADAPAESVPIACVAGDYDNDGRPDLFVVRYGTSGLYRNEGDGRFRDATAGAALPPYPFMPGAAAMSDVDHDGDLDLVIAGLADLVASRQAARGRSLVFPKDFSPAPLRLLRNNGNGAFTDITTASGLRTLTHAIAIVPTDFDNRRDIDLLIVERDRPPALFQNMRDGTFRNVATDVGLVAAVGAGDEVAAVTAADVNKDDFPDFFFARASGGVFALSDGRARFAAGPAPVGARSAVSAQFLDQDNDGLLDLLTWSADGAQIFRNLGGRWSDVSARSVLRPSSNLAWPESPRGLALADVDGDGTTDFLTAGAGPLTLWTRAAHGSTPRAAQRVVLAGRVSNRLGVGAKVQIRAGSLVARLETSATSPAVAPGDLLFGLGARSSVDTVRVLWPSGTLQAETATEPSQAPTRGGLTTSRPIVIEELDRKPSSCPALFTWNGERFEFISDFLGGGELGYWLAPGVRSTPDPVEYVRITSDQLQPRDGRFELRVTNELEEALFIDRLQLIAVTHPRGTTVYPNEGMTDPPKAFTLFVVADERVPRATDDHGHDVTDRIARVDRQYPDDFALGRVRGYAATHALVLDLTPVPVKPVLLLTAWTDYAFSSDNVAAHQAGLALTLPALQVKDSAGRWRTELPNVGIPVGRPQTVPIDLTSHLRRGEHEVRIVTNMRIYWDRAVVAAAVSQDPLQTARLDPQAATLDERGFSAEVRPDGRNPVVYDYASVSQASPWKVMPGRYTRLGDVRDLLTRTDDMFVIAKPGDAISLAFDARPADVPAAGGLRTFLLVADGFSKEMDINSASPDALEPLPFHGMTAYPYRPPDRYPDTAEHRRYQALYNTRIVVRSVPHIDTVRPR